MKGQQAIAPIMMIGVFLAVIGSVYLWGVPLIEKNKALVYLTRAESLVSDVAEKIRDVAAARGGQTFVFDLPGYAEFSNGTIVFVLDTKGTAYSPGVRQYLTNNRFGLSTRKMGIIDPVMAFVEVQKVGSKYRNSYVISTTPVTYGPDCIYINLTGSRAVGGQNTDFKLSYAGSVRIDDGSEYASYCSGRHTTVVNVRVSK